MSCWAAHCRNEPPFPFYSVQGNEPRSSFAYINMNFRINAERAPYSRVREYKPLGDRDVVNLRGGLLPRRAKLDPRGDTNYQHVGLRRFDPKTVGRGGGVFC